MSKKFEKIVNTPIEAVRRAGRRLQNKRIPENTPDKIVNIGDKKIRIPIKKIKKSARAGGLVATGMAVVVMWLTKYITLDNHLTRKLEELFAKIKTTDQEGKEKLWRKFIKKNPNLTGHLVYYMAIAMAMAGVDLVQEDSLIIDKGKKIKETIKEVVISDEDDTEDEERDQEIIAEPGTYGAYKARMHKVLPMIVTELVAMEGVRMENGMHVVYDDATGRPLKPGQKPVGRATIGYGNTVGKDHEAITSNTPPITSEEAFELSRWHLEEKETFLLMYCYDVACDGVSVDSVHEAMAIASMIYNGANLMIENSTMGVKNRFTEIRNLHKQYGDALTDEQVKAVFAKYPIKDPARVGKYWLYGGSESDAADGAGWYINTAKDGDGILWRRWLEACVMNGDITPQELLEVPVNGLSEFFKTVGRNRENWFVVRGTGNNQTRVVNKKTLARFRQWLKNPVNKYGQSLASLEKVRDVLPQDVVAQCMSSLDKLDVKTLKYTKTRRQQKVEKETYVLGYEEMYAAAIKEYKAGRFDVAAKKYEDMIQKYPNNALLYNDLAATYNRLGRYNDAIKMAREIVLRIGDKSQYGAAQYNAGYAYEQLGDLENARVNYRFAVSNGNMRVRKDLERVTRALQTKTKTIKTAFDDAAGRVKGLDGLDGKTVDYLAYVDGGRK